MSTHHCEECGTVLDPAKVLRCTKCKACFYCSAACQKRNWKRIHKRVCSADPALRPFIRVEMALERALERQPKVQAPKDAFCYICLEGEKCGKSSSKLLRNCACRGDSAGFVHLECLTELAVSKEASGDPENIFNAWTVCGNCKQQFTFALSLAMRRCFWRRHRSSGNQELRYASVRALADCLGVFDEIDSANRLYDEALQCAGNDEYLLLDVKLGRATVLLVESGQHLEALTLLESILPEAKEYTSFSPTPYTRTMEGIVFALRGLDRYQEAYETAADLVQFTKGALGPRDPRTLEAMQAYADICARVGRIEEGKVMVEDVFTKRSQIFGRDHPVTNQTRASMEDFGFTAATG